MRGRFASAGRSAECATDPDACREAALSLLERARRTRTDVARRLREKGYTEEVVASVIERLAGVGLLDDVEYARAFIAGRWGRRAAGWRNLEGELRRRGVGAADIAIARAGFVEQQGGADEVTLARRVVAQAARRYASLEPRVRHQRLYALLVRRGFDSDIIRQALRESDPSMDA